MICYIYVCICVCGITDVKSHVLDFVLLLLSRSDDVLANVKPPNVIFLNDIDSNRIILTRKQKHCQFCQKKKKRV